MKSLTVLGRAIVRLRKDRGWTQEDLADRAGLSAPFIAALERAKRTPSIATLDALCAAFTLSPSALFAAGEDDTPTRRADRDALVDAVAALPHANLNELLGLVDAVARVVRSAALRTTTAPPSRSTPKSAKKRS